MSSIPNTGQNLRPDPELIREGLEAVKHPDSPIEIRILNTRSSGPCRLYGRTYNGFYDDLHAAVRDISRISGRDAGGVYMTINPLDPIVRNWNYNRLDRTVKAAEDQHVTSLRHLYVDIDPKRPAFTNANAEEHAAAMRTLDEIKAHLHAEGWEAPVLAGSSGSGAMALWRIDLPRDEAEHIQRALAALAHLFTNDVVTIDTGVGNPARIARVPGTVNAKSPTPQPDRPWTLATAKPVGEP